MPDPIEQLRDLEHEGLPVHPLPATEVRRRGDRLRRRNTMLAAAGAVAAVLVVATPLAVLAGGQDTSAPQPAPAPAVEWVRTVPDDFDVTALPAGASFAFTARDASVVDDFVLCGRPTFSTESDDPVGPATDTAGASYGQPGTDGNAARTLALYEDDRTAADAVQGFRTSVQDCPEDPRGRGAPLVYDAVDVPVPAEDSFVFTQQARMDQDLLADLTVIQVSRVGNAVLVATDHTSAGGAQVADAEARRLTEWSAPLLSSMCVFAAEPCDAPAGPASTQSSPVIGEGAVSAIPANFPLARGLSSPEGDPLDGPSAEAEGVPALDLCGAAPWPAPDTVERLAVTATGPEYRESRELVTFARTDDASGALAGVRQAVEACAVVPGETSADDQQVELQPILTNDLAADEEVTFSVTYRQGLGGGVYQFVRVGRAVYGTYAGGEYARDTVGQAVAGVTHKTGSLVPRLCPWTEQGC